MARRTAGRPLSIGAVLTALQGDFPDVTISKIRFLEAEGLVTPARTASGYRQFAESDVDRLRYVLAAQRDRFWPLKVIRDALDAIDRGLEPPEEGGGRPEPPAPLADADVPGAEVIGRPAKRLRLTRGELAEAAGLDGATLDAVVSFGLVRPGGDGHFDAHDLEIARAVGELSTFGMEPRHLRPFRTAADREVALVDQVTIGVRGGSAAVAARRAEALRACIALHTALVRAGIDENR